MKLTLTILLALLLSFFSIQECAAQSGVYGGFSILNMEMLRPRPGVFIGFESGGKQYKYSIGFRASVARFGLTNDTVFATRISTGETGIPLAFKRKKGYMSIPIMLKYYLFDTEETIGSNVSFGLGITLLLTSTRTLDVYDRSVYQVPESSYQHYVGRQVNTALSGEICYQYSFDSGLAVTAQMGYELGFENIREYLGKQPSYSGVSNVLTFGVGTKYIF